MMFVEKMCQNSSKRNCQVYTIIGTIKCCEAVLAEESNPLSMRGDIYYISSVLIVEF